MNLIKLFFLGVSGYFLAALYDIALLYKRTALSRVLYVGFFVTAIPFVLLFSQYGSPHSAWLKSILILLMIGSALLLAYSVLLEFLLRNKTPGSLYTQGTYRICRHPGFHWHFFFSLCAALYFWYAPITLVVAGFVLSNFLLVLWEDKLLFPKLFPTYGEYKKTTPFLNPFQGR
ncbi:MAG: hypothetical protein GX315_08120 [Spirochaetales bacterium]|jgi:protein-S-isoprenylcysteine O-methyltransferase Ste14|nr:hypothetical protein [Spirochaetales bacterium]